MRRLLKSGECGVIGFVSADSLISVIARFGLYPSGMSPSGIQLQLEGNKYADLYVDEIVGEVPTDIIELFDRSQIAEAFTRLDDLGYPPYDPSESKSGGLGIWDAL